MRLGRAILIAVIAVVLVLSIVFAIQGSAGLWWTAVGMLALLVSQALQLRSARRESARREAAQREATTADPDRSTP